MYIPSKIKVIFQEYIGYVPRTYTYIECLNWEGGLRTELNYYFFCVTQLVSCWQPLFCFDAIECCPWSFYKVPAKKCYEWFFQYVTITGFCEIPSSLPQTFYDISMYFYYTPYGNSRFQNWCVVVDWVGW